MPELAPPQTRGQRHRARLTQVEWLRGQQNLLDLQMRTLLTSLVCEDTLIGLQKHVADEVALHLNESPGTAERLVTAARVFCDFPAIMAQVADNAGAPARCSAVGEGRPSIPVRTNPVRTTRLPRGSPAT